jgi:hypothetical protein
MTLPDAGVQALPALWAGCHFRSRLEARCAVFFDRLDIAWEYEPEGFDTSSTPRPGGTCPN